MRNGQDYFGTKQADSPLRQLLILGSIGASLRRDSHCEVMTLLPSAPQETPDIDFLKPNVLLFALEATQEDFLFSLLHTNSDMSLIGISPGDNHVQVWSSRQFRELLMKELIELVMMTDVNREAATRMGKGEVERKDSMLTIKEPLPSV
jgi:hypothetical protein